MIPRRSAPTARPFVTRRSTIGFAAAFMVGDTLTYLSPEHPGPGIVGFTVALIYATTLVTLVVAWVAGGILAWRSRSLLWLLIAFLPPPFGAIPCALFAPATPAGSPPPGGRR
jgi:hypothetical protein